MEPKIEWKANRKISLLLCKQTNAKSVALLYQTRLVLHFAKTGEMKTCCSTLSRAVASLEHLETAAGHFCWQDSRKTDFAASWLQPYNSPRGRGNGLLAHANPSGARNSTNRLKLLHCFAFSATYPKRGEQVNIERKMQGKKQKGTKQFKKTWRSIALM